MTVFIFAVLLFGFCYINIDGITSCDVSGITGCCRAICPGGRDNTVHVQSVQQQRQPLPVIINSGMVSSVHPQQPIYVPAVTPIVQPQHPIYVPAVTTIVQPVYVPDVKQAIYAPEVGRQMYVPEVGPPIHAPEVRPGVHPIKTSLAPAVQPRQSLVTHGGTLVIQPQTTLYASQIKGTVRPPPLFFAQPYDGPGAVERQNERM